MDCKFKDKLIPYLEEKLSKEEMQIIEAHIDECELCQKSLDDLIKKESLNILLPMEEIEDEILIERIKIRKSGVRRIILYGVLGFILGLFSHYYTMDKFIVTKAIMALPYKLAEFGLGLFFSNNVLSPWQHMGYHHVTPGMGYFPFNRVLDFLASILTPAILSCFGALIIGYLFSDKRVFQRKRILRFLVTAVSVFLIWIVILHGIYAFTLDKIDKFEGINDITIYSVNIGSSSWVMTIDKEALQEKKYMKLIEQISNAKKKFNKAGYPEERHGFELSIGFSGGGNMLAYVEDDSEEMIMQNGTVYTISYDVIEMLTDIAGGVGDE
ncbi:MAG TPA: zf-HC2 domain-containing protein [Thermoanaerobacterales bacterium]|nr:zf-HC2 domain-containing protein [Thermoanaerobacterales bacterium]